MAGDGRATTGAQGAPALEAKVLTVSDGVAGGSQEGIRNATANNQLVDFVGQGFKHHKLGRHLGTAHYRHHGAGRFAKGLLQVIQLSCQ